MLPVRARANPIARLLVTALAAASSAVVARDARADVSSWMAVGGGSGLQLNRDSASRDFAGSLTYSLGVGSSPLSSFVLGGPASRADVLRPRNGPRPRGAGVDGGICPRRLGRSPRRGRPAGDPGATATSASGRSRRCSRSARRGVCSSRSAGSSRASRAARPRRASSPRSRSNLLRFTVMRQGSTERWWPNPVPAGGHESAANAASGGEADRVLRRHDGGRALCATAS